MNTPNPNLPALPADFMLPNPHIESAEQSYTAPPELQEAYGKLWQAEQNEIAKGVDPRLLPMAGATIRAAEKARSDVTDPLTGLLNRQGLDMVFERKKPDRFAVIFSDGRKFGEINKRYGHAVGDGTINFIGSNVASRLRTRDEPAKREERAHPEARDLSAAVGRWGGDEILSVVDLSHIDPGKEQEVAETIVNRLKDFGTYHDPSGIDIPIQIDSTYLISNKQDPRTLAEYQTQLDEMLDTVKRPPQA